MIPPWAMYLGGIAVAAGIYLKGMSDGKEAEQNRWLKKEAVATEATRAREDAMQAQIDAAGVALSMSTAEIERLSKRPTTNVRNTYAARPDSNLPCLDADILRLVKDSDQGSEDSSPAAAGAGQVRNPAD